MSILREGDLQIRLPRGTLARKFDDESHGLSHCMKAVDFIVEYDEKIFFIEFKDPEDSRSTRARRRLFVRKFKAGRLDETLVRKCRDTFLYEWAARRLSKPIHYLVLVAIKRLDDALLMARTDALKRHLPIQGPASGAWSRMFVEECVVFNIDAWNKHLPIFPVNRIVP